MAYTLLEYIESTGSQYINSNYNPNSNTKIIAVVSGWTSAAKSTSLFGTITPRYDVYVSSGGYFRAYYNGAYVQFSNVSCENITTIIRDGTSITIGETTMTNTAGTFTGSLPLYLFAHNNGSGPANWSSLRVYSFQVYDNGTLVRDYVPAKDESGNVGLLDQANNAFYKDAAGGNFVAGPEIVAEYNIVNVTILNKAMTATANAIRTKTGESAALTWNETSGFKAAIDAMSGGMQYATGTVTPLTTSTSSSGTTIFSVSGLSFTPKFVAIRIQSKLSSLGSKYNITSIFGGLTSGSTCYDSAQARIDGEPMHSVTLNSNGFVIKTNESQDYKYGNQYSYIAIG